MSAESQQLNQPELEQEVRALYRQLDGTGAYRGIQALALFNLMVLYCRPQNDITPLGWIAMPMVMSLIAMFLILPQIPSLWGRSPIVRGMVCFLLLASAWGPFARNNFWVYVTCRDLGQQYLGYFAPLLIAFNNGRAIRRILTMVTWIVLYLALYSVAHSGHGPGSYMGDENDMCLTLISLTGILLMMWSVVPGGISRVFTLLAMVAGLGGAVATTSRGGFVGLVAAFGVMYWNSTRKVATLFAAVIIGICGLLAVPQSYWNEMGTITNTKEDTADQRLQIWSIALNMWLTPKNFLFGVGTMNAPNHLGDYEPAVNRSDSGKSFSGRQVHSTYMQLVADLGLAGALIYAYILWHILRGNARMRKHVRRLGRRVPAIVSAVRALAPPETPAGDTARSPESEAEGGEGSVLLYTDRVLNRIPREADYTAAFLAGLNVALIGTLGAAGFISTLYYPPVWFIATMSVLLQGHASRLIQSVEGIAGLMPETAPVRGPR